MITHTPSRWRSTLPAWLGTARQWHWVSSAMCLTCLLLFALTGITLNHADRIEARPSVTSVEQTLPDAVLDNLAGPELGQIPLPPSLRQWARDELNLTLPAAPAEWQDDEIYLQLAWPGGDAWLSVDRITGELVYERTDRGWLAFLNDLHRGHNAGFWWARFTDLFAVSCLVFCISGLVLLKRHAPGRPATWPLVGLGVVLPVMLVLLFALTH